MSDSLQPHGFCQALLSMGVSRPEHWSGLPCPPPGDLPDPWIKARSPASRKASSFRGKESTCKAGDTGDGGLIPGPGRSAEEEMATHSNILARRIPRDRGAWQATVQRVTKGRTGLTEHSPSAGKHRSNRSRVTWSLVLTLLLPHPMILS